MPKKLPAWSASTLPRLTEAHLIRSSAGVWKQFTGKMTLECSSVRRWQVDEWREMKIEKCNRALCASSHTFKCRCCVPDAWARLLRFSCRGVFFSARKWKESERIKTCSSKFTSTRCRNLRSQDAEERLVNFVSSFVIEPACAAIACAPHSGTGENAVAL